MGIAELGQTITVVNKSGKVVSTSKHLINAFKEAKSAYRERKAEIKAVRNAEVEEKRARRALQAVKLDDDKNSKASSRPSSRAPKDPHRTRPRRERPPVERGYSDSFYANDALPPRSPTLHRSRTSPLRHEHTFDTDPHSHELVRRHTDSSITTSRRPPSRATDDSHIDMDLAYGELPPPLPVRRLDDEAELRTKMTTLQQLLDEANCIQHSVTATIESLHKNPEALAAVALTLAEISNLAAKMAPGVLGALKGSFPAVVALLASPQFMIAAGVGVGVTVVALGGYKIIKKIKQRKDGGAEMEARMELQEIDRDVSRIEMWRRGIADAEAESLGTSVDGEFVTPVASRRLIDEGVLLPEELKSTKSERSKKEKDKKRSKSKASKDSASSRSRSEAKAKRKKEPSGLRMLFKSGSS